MISSPPIRLLTRKLDPLNDSHAILLVGHGTRDTAGTEQFFQLSDRLSSIVPVGTTVQPALLEFQSPNIVEAWARIADGSPRRITVAPLLLFAAGHAKSDIPNEVQHAAEATPIASLQSIRHCPPISRQPAMIAAVGERLTDTLSRGSIPGSETGIVMVGRGSYDPCASADMRMLAEIVCFAKTGDQPSIAERFSIRRTNVQTTFYAMAQPRLPETIRQLAASGRVKRIVVHPHLLFSGRLHDAIVEQTQACADEFPDLRFDVSECLGPSDLVAQSMLQRILGSAAIR